MASPHPRTSTMACVLLAGALIPRLGALEPRGHLPGSWGRAGPSPVRAALGLLQTSGLGRGLVVEACPAHAGPWVPSAENF